MLYVYYVCKSARLQGSGTGKCISCYYLGSPFNFAHGGPGMTCDVTLLASMGYLWRCLISP